MKNRNISNQSCRISIVEMRHDYSHFVMAENPSELNSARGAALSSKINCFKDRPEKA